MPLKRFEKKPRFFIIDSYKKYINDHELWITYYVDHFKIGISPSNIMNTCIFRYDNIFNKTENNNLEKLFDNINKKEDEEFIISLILNKLEINVNELIQESITRFKREETPYIER